MILIGRKTLQSFRKRFALTFESNETCPAGLRAALEHGYFADFSEMRLCVLHSQSARPYERPIETNRHRALGK